MEDYQILYVTIPRDIFKPYIKEIDGLRLDGHSVIIYEIHKQSKGWITLELKSFAAISFYHLGRRVAHLY